MAYTALTLGVHPMGSVLYEPYSTDCHGISITNMPLWICTLPTFNPHKVKFQCLSHGECLPNYMCSVHIKSTVHVLWLSESRHEVYSFNCQYSSHSFSMSKDFHFIWTRRHTEPSALSLQHWIISCSHTLTRYLAATDSSVCLFPVIHVWPTTLLFFYCLWECIANTNWMFQKKPPPLFPPLPTLDWKQ